MAHRSAPSLHELQRWMQARVAASRAGTAVNARVRLNPQRGVPGEARLAVYADGYLARTREALAEVYEAVQHVAGEASFSELARAYAAQRPSREYNLTFIGADLPAFLAGHPLTQRLPFLPDLATLEWLVCRAFHAFDQPPLVPATLAGRPLDAWARTRLRFQPSVGVAASPWPILDIWDARRQLRSAINVPIDGRPQSVLVFRDALQTRCELLEPAQHAVLSRLLQGQTLGEACAALPDAAASQIAAWFARWAGAGLLIAAEFGDNHRMKKSA